MFYRGVVKGILYQVSVPCNPSSISVSSGRAPAEPVSGQLVGDPLVENFAHRERDDDSMALSEEGVDFG